MSDAENTAAERPGKPVGKPFQKGQSGNPGGRPKAWRELREALAGDFPGVVEVLTRNALAGEPWAVKEFLDRYCGKATVGEPDEDGAQRALVINILTGVTRGEG